MTDHRVDCAEALAFEVVPDGEEAARQAITAMTVQLQDKRKALQDGEVLRGVHAKSHGCLEAEFVVNSDLPADLQVGLFATPGRCFKAKIRYSNADVLKRADIEKDTDTDGNRIMKHGSRGMAIKVLDVDGPVLLEDGSARNQDFLMVNTPEFAFRNVRDYRRLMAALLVSEDGATPDLFFLPAKMLQLGMMDMSGTLLPASENETAEMARMRGAFENLDIVFADYTAEDLAGALSAARVVRKIQTLSVTNPLDVPYFSAAPFRFGPNRVMRFSAAPLHPVASESDFDHDAFETADDDYLSQALSRAMNRKETISLAFRVQIATAADIAGNEAEMIENTSVAWDESAFPFIEVARIVIDPCRQGKELVDACKPYLFTPWHALAEHEPLGGINRLRKPVYTASADFRRAP